MLLALDVGNTNTVLGLYRLEGEKPELAAHWRVTTHRTQTVDEYGVFFVNLFEMHGMAPSQVTHIIIASVVPPVESTLRQVCKDYFHIEPIPPNWAPTGYATRSLPSSATAGLASLWTLAQQPSLK